MSSETAPRFHPDYHRIVVKFMSYKHNIAYDKKHRFHDDEMLDWTANEVYEWMRKDTIGDVLETEVDEKKTIFNYRSTSLAFHKKALSWYFSGDKDANWSKKYLTGNPTKSVPVNKFIQFVQRCEVRKFEKAKKSKAKHPLTMTMFRAALRILEQDHDNFNHYYRYPTMLKFQYHLIGRSDDLGNFKTRDLKSHSNPIFSQIALQTKVYWSKNVMEERDCPDQILFGSWDVDYCILIALGLYLEIGFIHGTGRLGELLFSDEVTLRSRGNVKRLKNRYQTVLTKHVFVHPTFIPLMKKGKAYGTHSIRKYASSFARSNNCSKDDINCRGRWKSDSKKTVDRYIDVEQEWIDGKVGGTLCVGGPIRYVPVEGSNISKDWLFENVVQGIAAFFLDEDNEEENLVWVLGLAVLWTCMHPDHSSKVPGWLLRHVREQYEVIRRLPVGVNPVERIKIMVYAVNGELRVTDLDVEPVLANDGLAVAMGEGRTIGGAGDNTNYHILQMMGVMQQQSSTMHTMLETINYEVRNNSNVFRGRIGRLERNVNAFINRPFQIVRNNNNNNNNNKTTTTTTTTTETTTTTTTTTTTLITITIII